MSALPVTWVVVAAIGCTVLAAIITKMVRDYALRAGILDTPNHRSSHKVATPRSGGIAIVIGMLCSLGFLFVAGQLSAPLCIALGGGGIAVAAIGYADDRWHVSPRLRLLVHFAAAAWALAWIGVLPTLQLGATAASLEWVGYIVGSIFIVWTLNLFNFMDGIDGIAASEALFMSCAWAVLAWTAQPGLAVLSLLFGAACLGFLCWNWPPAKIFMGDVGSGFIGFVIAVLAVAAASEEPPAIFTWIILGAVFFVDATVTLLTRFMRGERVTDAHRSHAYQRLSRRWGTHRRTTLSVLCVNLTWLLPLAMCATTWPSRAPLFAAVSLVPLIGVAVWAGAGRAEEISGPNV